MSESHLEKNRKRQVVHAIDTDVDPHKSIVSGLTLRHYEEFDQRGVSHLFRSKEEVKVSFAEVVYDLAIVVGLAVITDQMRESLSGVTVCHAFLMILVIVQQWGQVTDIFNRYDSKDLITRVYLFVQLFAVSIFSSYHVVSWETEEIDERPQRAIALMVIGARLSTTLVRALAYVQFPAVRARTKLTFVEDLCFCALTAPALGIDAGTMDPDWWFAAAWFSSAVVFPLLARLIYGKAGQTTVIREHMIERYLLLTIIAIGEIAFAAVFGPERWEAATAGTWLCTISACALIMSLVVIYIDVDHREETFTRHALQNGFFPSFLWALLHGPLMVAINFTGAGAKHAIDETLDTSEPLTEEDFFLFSHSAAAILVIITALRLLHTESRVHVFRNPMILIIRAIGVVILAILPVDPDGIPAPSLCAIIAGVFVVIAGLSLVGNLRHRSSAPSKTTDAARGSSHSEDDASSSYSVYDSSSGYDSASSSFSSA